MDGTSQATPCVTGVICLMLQKNPSLTPAQICETLETTATKLSETKSNETGSGCVNALLAIESIEENNGTTNINDYYNVDLNIYPNPVNDRLYIEAEVDVEEVAIFDIYGRVQKISAISYQPSVIDVSDLNGGVYFVKINTANGNTIVKRFIKE